MTKTGRYRPVDADYIDYRPSTICSKFSKIQRSRYRQKQAEEYRIPKTDVATQLGITRPTLNNWELRIIPLIPDYCEQFQTRRGLTPYQIWVLQKVIPQLRNQKGSPKLTWEDIEVSIEQMAEKLTMEDWLVEQRRSSKAT